MLQTPSAEQLPAIQAALQVAGLPFADLTRDHLPHFLIAMDESGHVTHCAGVEPVAVDGLLRSVVVAQTHRNAGDGGQLLNSLELHARGEGLRALYLLTTTAGPFFARHGYEPADRQAVPDALRRTAEFATLCPASATCMRKILNPLDLT